MIFPTFPIYLILLLQNLGKVLAGEKLRWLGMTEFNKDTAIASGFEDNPEIGNFINTYVIQCDYKGGMIIGKYSQEQGKCIAEFQDQEVVIENDKCRWLAWPPGTMSWLYATPQKLPDVNKMVKGGKTAQNIWYICRALGAEGDLLLGSLGANDKKCHAPYAGAGQMFERYEVLIPNLLGVRTETVAGQEKDMLG